MAEIYDLLDTNPDEIPEGSKFLLEFDFGNPGQSTLDDKTYWVVAMKAAIKAGQRQAAIGARRKRTLKKIQKKQSLRARFGYPKQRGRIALTNVPTRLLTNNDQQGRSAVELR